MYILPCEKIKIICQVLGRFNCMNGCNQGSAVSFDLFFTDMEENLLLL